MKIISKALMVAVIVVFSIFIHEFADEQFSIPLLYLSFVMPFLYAINLCIGKIKLDKIDILFIVQMILMYIFAAYHSDAFRQSTVLYSFLFIFTFLYYRKLLLSKSLPVDELLGLLRYLMYAYAFVMLIQQVQLYVLHTSVSNSGQLASNAIGNAQKLNSLAIESSNVPLIELLLLNLYLGIDEHLHKYSKNISKSFVRNKIIWICFIYTLISTTSLTSLFVIIIFLFRFIKLNLRSVLVALFFITSLFAILNVSFQDNVDRFVNVIVSFSSLDTTKIIANDSSSAARLFPFIEYYNVFNITDINTWIGHGNDSFSRHINIVMFGDPDMNEGVGNIAGFFYDYGLIVALLFFFILKITFKCKVLSYEVFMYIFCFSILTINHYVLWTYIIYMYTGNKYREFIGASLIFSKVTDHERKLAI